MLGCSSVILLHEETEVETDCRHLLLFSFTTCLRIFVISFALMPIRQPYAPHAERASWMVIGMAFQVVLSALCLGERHWTR